VPSWHIFFLPFLVLVAILAALGPGLWTAALNVKYRDFRYVIPFVVQFGLYVSPVGFSSSIVPSKWRLLYSLNPLVGVIDGFRYCILGGSNDLYWPGATLSLTVITVLLWLGVRQFRKVERTFADLI
jgi:lipopolysaccharide transport system permease protein